MPRQKSPFPRTASTTFPAESSSASMAAIITSGAMAPPKIGTNVTG